MNKIILASANGVKKFYNIGKLMNIKNDKALNYAAAFSQIEQMARFIEFHQPHH